MKLNYEYYSTNIKGNKMISREEVLKVLRYDAATGIFTRKVKTSNCVKVGDEAGCVNVISGKPYRKIGVNGRQYLAQRLAWLIITGEFPEDRIGHINGDSLDNRAENLRFVRHAENETLTREEVLKLLEYNPVTGTFRWKVARGGVNVCAEVGSVEVNGGKSYHHLTVSGRRYYAHRLAWLVITGEFPTDEIDHIDGNGMNNRAANLRSVTRKENCKNTRRRVTNTSGVTGVHWNNARSKWHAQIQLDGKNIFLGRFEDFDEAVAVRKEAEKKLGFHPNHGSDRPL